MKLSEFIDEVTPVSEEQGKLELVINVGTPEDGDIWLPVTGLRFNYMEGQAEVEAEGSF